jgi:uncharacterized membrane protein
MTIFKSLCFVLCLLVPLDMDVHVKALLLGAVFLIVSSKLTAATLNKVSPSFISIMSCH